MVRRNSSVREYGRLSATNALILVYDPWYCWAQVHRVMSIGLLCICTGSTRNGRSMSLLYDKVLILQESITKYEECFSTNNNSDLLYKSYISGQITLLNYLLETDYYLSSHAKHLQLRRNLELVLSELNMWKL